MYDLLYKSGSYVHWYSREGVEKNDFEDAREDLRFLYHDYQDVLNESDEDETDFEESGPDDDY